MIVSNHTSNRHLARLQMIPPPENFLGQVTADMLAMERLIRQRQEPG